MAVQFVSHYQALPLADAYERSSLRITSFRPDHTSVTAHTLMSTKPSGSATSRTVSSVMSVGTFDPFFGQDTHTIAVGFSLPRQECSVFARSVLREVKIWTRSVFLDSRGVIFTSSGIGSTSFK